MQQKSVFIDSATRTWASEEQVCRFDSRTCSLESLRGSQVLPEPVCLLFRRSDLLHGASAGDWLGIVRQSACAVTEGVFCLFFFAFSFGVIGIFSLKCYKSTTDTSHGETKHNQKKKSAHLL